YIFLYVVSVFTTYNTLCADAPVVSPLTPSWVASNRPTISFNTSMSEGTSILDESVELFVDAIKVPVERDGEGVWNGAITWDLTEGSHWASVALIGLNGNAGGGKWNFVIDLSNPAVQITSPVNQQGLLGPNMTVAGAFGGLTHPDDSTITVRVDEGAANAAT